MLVFVGSAGKGTPYLKDPSKGTGVVSSFLLASDGQLKPGAGPYTVGDNPTAIVPHANGNGLIISSETYGDANATVWSVAMDDPSTGAFHVLNQTDAGGRACCHLALHPSGTHVAWSNYLGESKDPQNRGTFGICELDSQGMLQKRTMNVPTANTHPFPGANAGRQEASHVHSCLFVPMADGRHALFVCDLGADKIFQYIVSTDGVATLNPEAPSVAAHQAGAGPRHAVAHPTKPFVYVVTEMLSTVQVHAFDAAGGKLSEKPLQALSCIEPGHSRAGDDSYTNAACLKIHPGGQFLYGSNRGHDSIVIYKVGDDGLLSFVACEMTDGFKVCGMGPRDFDVSPCGKLLVLANQDNDLVVSYSINCETGLLTKVGEIACTTPVSVRVMAVNGSSKV